MFKQSLSYLSSSALVVVINFITLPYFTSFLSLSDYGKLALFILFGNLASNLISFGLQQAAYRFYFKYDENIFAIINSTIIIFLIIIFSLAWFFVINPFAELFSRSIFNDEISAELLKLGFISGCFQYFYLYLINLLVASKRANEVSFILVFHAFNNALLTFYFINWQSMTYLAPIYAVFIANIISFSIALIQNRSLFSPIFSLEKLVMSTKFSYPEIPGILVSLLYSSFDRSMLSNLKGASSVGYYEFGNRFAIILKHFIDSISKSWSPFFMEFAEKNTIESKSSITKRYYQIIFIFGFLGLCVSSFSEEGLIILTTEEFYKAKYLVPILVMQMLFGSLGLISVNQIMFAGKLIYNLPVSVVSLSVNIFLNILLIPQFGALGAVIATAISTILSSILLFLLGKRAFPLPFDYLKLSCHFLLIAIITILIYSTLYFDFGIIYKIMLKFSYLAMYTFFSMKIGTIGRDDLIVFYETAQKKLR